MDSLVWAQFKPCGPISWKYGGGQSEALEVAVAATKAPPGKNSVIDIWKHRRDKRAAPVLLVILCTNETILCGSTGEKPPVYEKIERGQAERICAEALDQPDKHAALRYLSQSLPSLDTAIPGLLNSGLLALNELLLGTPKREDWSSARKHALISRGKTEQDLLRALGYQIKKIDNLTSVLQVKNSNTAIAVLLNKSEYPDKRTKRFNNLSPVSYALAKADDKELQLPWVIMLQGNRLRLYSTSVTTGVGRRGRAETFIECLPNLLSDENLAYIWLLFSADALKSGGSLKDVIKDSERFAGNLAIDLRERIYNKVMPVLAQGIASARKLSNPNFDDLAQTYEMSLTVLFRLLFVAYAEDRDLLPYKLNPEYKNRSLKEKAVQLARRVANKEPIAEGNHHWQEAKLLWNAISKGNNEWGVPAYNGGLFSIDPNESLAGAELEKIDLPNDVFEMALQNLLVTKIEGDEYGPVDFRSLSVREFGDIYEGLLESELAIAQTDLFLDKNGHYQPTNNEKQRIVNKGEIYIHNRSGQRKASGSYYTKSFAVEHLLDGALEPALEDHLNALSSIKDDSKAADKFFDFRVADIAMGSGHFLVAAIDRIEKRMSGWLVERPLEGVQEELSHLRQSALKEIGSQANKNPVIEDGQLLRRMIARKCIYGVDINPLSVQLARLSIWIHTFVPGLPLSVLDYSLIHGNSLIGIGNFDEINSRLQGDIESAPFFTQFTSDYLLSLTKEPLEKLALLNDATLDDIERHHKAQAELKDIIAPTRNLCDLITLEPLSDGINLTNIVDRVSELGQPLSPSDDIILSNFVENNLEQNQTSKLFEDEIEKARQELKNLNPVHFPVEFPEVFLRDNPGFNVIIGNPPWKEAKFEEINFCVPLIPGLKKLSPLEKECKINKLKDEQPDLQAKFLVEKRKMETFAKALNACNYPGMGTGDPDLYKAFAWRFWHLTVHEGGRIGVVLPFSAMITKGSMEFRINAIKGSSSFNLSILQNKKGWVFPDISSLYTISLICITIGDPEENTVHLKGPYQSLKEFKSSNSEKTHPSFSCTEVLSWTDTASLPNLPRADSFDVFKQFMKAQRLDLNVPNKWRARPDTELHAAIDKKLMNFEFKECPENYWPVYKGASFNLWDPDTKKYYAFANPSTVQNFLQKKRDKANRNKRSAHSEFPKNYIQDKSTLASNYPRVAFRGVSGKTNRRTIIACLLPPNIFLANGSPYFHWPIGNKSDQAFLLGILSSIPLDWYARRFIEVNINFHLINSFPIPRPTSDNPKWKRVVSLAGRLASPDERFAEWASAVGVEHGPIDEAQKQDMIFELDALSACIYGLTEVQLIHIFETFHEGWDYEERLSNVLKHFNFWNQK